MVEEARGKATKRVARKPAGRATKKASAAAAPSGPSKAAPRPRARKTVKAAPRKAAAVTGAAEPRIEPTGAERISASVSPEQRRAMIAEAAYFKAEARGFVGGDPEQDWREAEAEIDALLLR